MSGTGKPLDSAAGAVLCSAAGAVLYDGAAATRVCALSEISSSQPTMQWDPYHGYSNAYYIGTWTKVIRITNTGNAPLVVTNVSINVTWTFGGTITTNISPTSFTVAPGGHVDVTLTATPATYNVTTADPVANGAAAIFSNVVITSNATSSSGTIYWAPENYSYGCD